MNFLILCLLMAEIPDLGVISQRTGATIDLNSTRPGFVRYVIEVKPSSPPTNLVTLTLTNNLLTIGDMQQIPSGPGILGVKAVYADGEESECAVYRYDLRRSKPSAPSMTPTHIGTSPEGSSSLTNAIRRIKERFVPEPPMPRKQFVYIPSKVFAPEYTSGLQFDQPRPLPGSTNLSYFQFLDRIADSSVWGRRRSQ